MAKNKHKHEREDRAEQTLTPEEAAAKAAAEAAECLRSSFRSLITLSGA